MRHSVSFPIRFIYYLFPSSFSKSEKLCKGYVTKAKAAASPNPALSNPPAFAARIPAFASSTTRHFPGHSPRYCAAHRNTSGSGFDLVILVPSLTASKYPVSPSLFKISLVFLLEDPIASFHPRLRSVSIVFRTSSDKSASPIFCSRPTYNWFFFSASATFCAAVSGSP